MASTAPSISWFPFDVHLDDKFELIEAEFGLTGFAVVVKLLQKIYGGQGYYCEWTEDVALLFSKNIGLGGNVVSEIVRASVKRGIFDKNIYDRYSVLTSKGIQERYLDAVSRRKNVDFKNEYLLVCVDKKQDNVNISTPNVNISDENVYISEQIREDKRREDKSILNNKKEDDFVVMSKLIKAYEDSIGIIIPYILKSMKEWVNKVEPEVIEWAIKQAALRNAPNWKYIEGILNNQFNAGNTTMSQVDSSRRKYGKDTSVYEDNTGFDYDSVEKIMQEKYDKE